MRHILCAAIHFFDENVYRFSPKNIDTGIVVTGRRHHDCFAVMRQLSGKSASDWTGHKQGFLTNDDCFVDRNEAARIALEAGQIKKKTNTLFSEDLY
jgi:hypothetical protein